MKSIFDAADNAEIIDRINLLSADTPARWGKMNTAQMMAHCQSSLNIAFGNSKRIRHWLGVVFGNISKKRLLKVKEFDRHMPTFKQALITDERNFDEEKEKFISLIKSAIIKGPECLVKYPHPYFSTFKSDEWARLNWKHLDHHLKQFGV
jgi:hypothetical protein